MEVSELKFISDRGAAIIKSLSGHMYYICIFHITDNLVRHVKRETRISASNDTAVLTNSLLVEISKLTDITEVVQKTRTITDIFRRALTIENTKKYGSMEGVSLYVGVEVVRYLMKKSNKEHWMTLAMSCDPCRYGYTTSSFAESYNNSIGYARSS